MAHLLVVDGANAIMRAYYTRPAKPESEEEERALIQGAVEVFYGMMRRYVRELSPTHMIVALDHTSPSFRAQLYPDYKANRKGRSGPTPSQLLDALRPHLADWGVVGFECPGFEADDILATLASKTVHAGQKATVVTRDSDALPLIDFGVTVLRPESKGVLLSVNPDWVEKRFGIKPFQIVDFKVLAGESGDNIPRVEAPMVSRAGKTLVRGVTEKRAAEYLRAYSDLDGIYDAVSSLPAVEAERLLACKEQAYFFRDLIRLRQDVPLDGLDLRASSIKNSVFR